MELWKTIKKLVTGGTSKRNKEGIMFDNVLEKYEIEDEISEKFNNYFIDSIQEIVLQQTYI